MIIKRLRIHNIASIADAEIDFQSEVLAQASVFLISGETGSGKTTLLDAICLALYAQTPRMMSSSREEITSQSDKQLKFYTNDNAQLLKRGTGEGFVSLSFEGNDGADYEAIWSVQRDYKKPHKKLQRPTRALTSLENSSYSETNKKRVEEKIIELTGMDYEQFCRTVMLAQGEFTKFLKSNRTEKSQILEKLTGSSIYSEIGKEIANRYLEIKRELEEIKKSHENVVILTEDELKDIDDKLSAITKGIKTNRITRDETEIKIKWLKDYENTEKKIGEKESEVTKIRDIIASDQFRNDKKLAEDYRLTETPRNLRKDISTQISDIEANDRLLAEIEKKLRDTLRKEEEANERINELESDITSCEKELDSYDLDKINSEHRTFSLQKDVLTSLSSTLEKLKLVERQLSEKTIERDTLINKEKELRSKIKISKDKLETAEKDRVKAIQNYDRLYSSISDAAKTLRSGLRVGDRCPVCGQEVLTQLGDNFFEAIFQPFKEEKEKAEEICIQITSDIKSNEKVLKDNLRKQKEANSKIIEIEDKVMNYKNEFDKNKELLSMSLSDTSDLCNYIFSMITDLKRKIDELSAKQSQAAVISRKLQSLQKDLKTKTGALKELKDKIILETNAKVALEGRQTEKRKNLARYESALRSFLDNNPAIELERVEQLEKVAVDEVLTIENEIKRIETALITETGILTGLKVEQERLLQQKPNFSDNEQQDVLKLRLSAIDRRIEEQNIRIGQLNERIKINQENLKLVEKILKEEERKSEEKDKWEELYKLLGDSDGAKFRAVAQSFILKSLLDNANAYMSTFTDRYLLTCNPGSLAIMVKDQLRPSDPQPASILSGGESFMASLSLALALSNLKGGGMNVDVLFIDEGFGTLSSEYLSNVMETLERLHRIGGKKVGLISHVPELKDRIPVQINVRRESPTLSKVEIITK